MKARSLSSVSSLRGASRALSALGLGVVSLSCASDFDTTRVVPPRGTLGEEAFSIVCDRVGANALREDVTGASYHAVCHPDASGNYALKVDQTLLVPLDPNAVDSDGRPVPMALQVQHRAYRVARIETMGARRVDLVGAFNAGFPDEQIPVKDLTNADPTKSCNAAGNGALHQALADFLGRLTDMENDRTMALFTEALARIMDDVRQLPDAQSALARFDARQGYRPSDIALGAARPALAYPRLVPLVNAFLKLIATDSDPLNPAGKIDPTQPLSITNRKPIPGAASGQFQELLAVLREELRTATATVPLVPLTVGSDPLIPTRPILSRPRSDLELTRQILLQQDPVYDIGGGTPTTRVLAQRDLRGVAVVPLVSGVVPAPFVDTTGAGGAPDGLPDLDPLGQFITTTQAPVPSPLFSVDGVDGPRDSVGRATTTGGAPLYGYFDTHQTFLANTANNFRPLLDPDPTKEAVMKLFGGVPIVAGARDATPSTTKTYAPDPSLVTDWPLVHSSPPPASLGTGPVNLTYSGFHTDQSPILDLVYALGQIMADPSMDDLLDLGRQLVTNHPQQLARLIGIGLQIKKIADAHPEAMIPAASTLWDEMLDQIGQIAHVQDGFGGGGILEDLFLAFEQNPTVALQQTFAAYIQYKDQLTYDHTSTNCSTYASATCKLNGPAFNLTTNDNSPLKTPVDRTMPDVGNNRSALQRFMQLLHDANGLAACTKDGAVAHIQFNVGLGVIPFDYPTDTTVSALACGIVGQPAPSKLPLCGVLRIPNVAALLLDVALNRATFDIRDPCLKALAASPLSGLVGGVDGFLQSQSGIAGFDTHPTVPGVGRLVYFETPAAGLPTDSNPATSQTSTFLAGVLDPVASMVCPPTPYTDPSDGTVLNIRTCTTPADTLRGRDPGFLFPIEQNDFITNVQALASVFDNDNRQQSLLFVDLFDTMDVHWGSSAQPKDVCDPTLPRTDARWCSQDGTVTYEPLLTDVLTNTDLFQALHDTVPIIAQTMVPHCDTQDPTTHACTKVEMKTGIQVLADAVRVMVDPARSAGMVDRQGNQFALRNDGTKNPQVTPIYLFIDALKGIDAAFAADAAANGGNAQKQTDWRDARSQLVDTFLSVNGTGTAATFANPALPKILPVLLDAVHAQLLANCPDRSSPSKCTWAQHDLANNLGDVIGGPTFAAVIDVLTAVKANDAARTELETLLQYLLDPASDNDARATTLAALTDVLQVLSDDANVSLLYQAIDEAAGASLTSDPDLGGTVVKRSLIDAAVETLSRIFAQAHNATGQELCDQEIDPDQAIAATMQSMVTPMGEGKLTPIEVLIDVVADVNRASPGDPSKLQGADYSNMANEISELCLDPGSGLEQVYEVVREATLK